MKIAIYINNSQSPTLDIWRNGNKIDMFDDESLNIVSKLNDIEKLSNVFSDFTLSFTVPATPKNSAIFKHYYDFDIDNSFNANIRIDAIIEIDTFPFKYGQIQLESVQLKDQRVDNYKITFYSKVSQLSELFGNDTIDLLDYDIINQEQVKVRNILSLYNFEYNSTNLIKTINDDTYLDNIIVTPLIAYTDRDWNYGNDDIFDISKDDSAIKNQELKQSIKCIKLIEGIEEKYNINFSRDFLDSVMFNKLYLWMNGKENKIGGGFQLELNNNINSIEGTTNYFTASADTTLNTFTYTDLAFNYSPIRNFYLSTTLVNVTTLDGLALNDTNFNIKFIDAVTNQIIHETNKTPNENGTLQGVFNIPQQPVSYSRTIKVEINAPVNFIYSSAKITFGGASVFAFIQTQFNNSDYLNFINIRSFLPNLKVIDFLTGIMKMFKLIIRPINQNTFYLNTIDGFYSFGNFLDITKYSNQESVEIKRPTIYSKISFKYEKTENILGKKFRQQNGGVDEIGYGDERAVYNIDSKNELEVKLPFENMLFEKLIDNSNIDETIDNTTNILIGQACKLEDDLTTIRVNDNMKALLFFYNGIENISVNSIKFKFKTETVVTLNNYKLVSNTDNSVLNNVTTCLNWGVEIDPWHRTEIETTLFNNFWKNWVETIYDKKQRKISYEAFLPSRYITELSLNDRIIIGDQRYKIEDYKVNLVDGKTQLNLFKDIF
jgi:hypothetical protein